MSFLNNDLISNIEDELTGKNKSGKKEKMHLRVQQRNGKKCITILEGLFPDIDPKKIIQKMKSKFACGGCVKTDDDGNTVITLTGDKRNDIVDFFTLRKIAEKNDFVLHGY